MNSIMTTEHKQWEEFANRLEGEEGCDFAEDESGKITWRCKGHRDKSLATKILGEMGDIDIPRSLAYFEEHGGHCDCEILFNVRF